jgi:hypothetical protein
MTTFTLTTTHLRFLCEAITPLRLEVENLRAGSNLRGALGQVMRRSYCAHASTPSPSPIRAGEGGYDLRFGRPPFVSHQKWHGWNCQVDIIPHGCCPVAETKINA